LIPGPFSKITHNYPARIASAGSFCIQLFIKAKISYNQEYYNKKLTNEIVPSKYKKNFKSFLLSDFATNIIFVIALFLWTC